MPRCPIDDDERHDAIPTVIRATDFIVRHVQKAMHVRVAGHIHSEWFAAGPGGHFAIRIAESRRLVDAVIRLNQ